LSSTDGETWTGGTGPIPGTLYGITYGSTGGYLAVGEDNSNPANTLYLSSPDGETWTGGTGPIQGALRAITYDAAGGYVAVGFAGGDTLYLSSPDGETWTGGTGPIQGILQGITYGSTGGYVAVGVDNSNPANNIVIYQTSPDGETWTGSAEMGGTSSSTIKTSITIDTLVDNTGSTGGPGQLLTAGAAGGGLTWTTGLTYTQGPTGPVLTLEGDLIPSADNTYSLGSTGTRWKGLYVATGSIHIGDATLSATGTSIIFNGDLIPSTTNTFSLGSVNNLVKSVHMGPGTVFIGPTGTLGNDPNGIIYAEYGLAAPTIALGASIPGTTGPVEGGVRLTLSGTTGPIQYQHIGVGGIAEGPIRTLLTQDFQNEGPTGPTGVMGVPGTSTGKTLYFDTAGGAAPTTGTIIEVPNTSAQTTISYTSVSSADDALIATFTTPENSTASTNVIGGLWRTNVYAVATLTGSGNTISFYTKIYHVDSLGGDETLMAEGSSSSATNIAEVLGVYDYALYVPDITLTSITRRFRVKIYALFTSSSNTLDLKFRESTTSHIHTTLVANTATGPTGSTGPTGQTGPTGPSISYQLGNNPYAASGSLITTTIGTAQTRIYQVGPITTTASTKLLIMANASFISSDKQVSMTVGRATTSGATAANSTNIVSGTSPVTLPTTSPSYYMAAVSHGNNIQANVNGFAIDAPGAGTFYYTIWMSSSGSHNYSDMTAVLTALQIT
jgi:hypothetical protein